MANSHSFKEYISSSFSNEFWEAAEGYVHDNVDTLCGDLRHVHRAGEPEIEDVTVKHVWTDCLPDMHLQFDVVLAVTITIPEADYQYDDYDEKTFWLMGRCSGSLEDHLEDFDIFEVAAYNGKNRAENPLDDSLVPYIKYEKLEDEADDFLKKNYPEALKITPHGEPPVWVDPSVLAERLKLKVKTRRIKKDSSVFGQLYFEDADPDLYDEVTEEEKPTHVDGRTILVDPNMYLLRNLGSVNNTIVHECVHWDKHRTAFALAKLYNEDTSCVSCEVVGGAESPIAQSATEFMERQANQLAPRIQMPAKPFIAKANEYIGTFMRSMDVKHTIDVIEAVIDQLAVDYEVSRQAVKIRMVELGFEEAIGTFTYVDNHYVRPHSFKKGAIKINQTFSISTQDAALQRFTNLDLRKLTDNGDYLFVENHFVYNAPLYVRYGEQGSLELTDYARAHMEECCLVFDMTITSHIGNEYHTVCYLNREPNNYSFEIKFNNGYQNAPQNRQVAMRQKEQAEIIEIRKQMTDDPVQCMQLILDWRHRTYTDLGDAIDRDPKTISRIVKGETAPKPETVWLICFELHLPPVISMKLLEVLGCPIKIFDSKQQWVYEALHVKYPEPLWAVREYLAPYGVEI